MADTAGMIQQRSELGGVTPSVLFSGGFAAFGIAGTFVGPVILVVAYTLLDSRVGTAPAVNTTQ